MCATSFYDLHILLRNPPNVTTNEWLEYCTAINILIGLKKDYKTKSNFSGPPSFKSNNPLNFAFPKILLKIKLHFPLSKLGKFSNSHLFMKVTRIHLYVLHVTVHMCDAPKCHMSEERFFRAHCSAAAVRQQIVKTYPSA